MSEGLGENVCTSPFGGTIYYSRLFRQVLAARPFDVLVVALRLGAFNGLHLVITARAAYPELRAVLTTSADDRALASEARQVDAACLVKPIVRDALLTAVAQGHNES